MSGPQALISPDGRWWWDGQRWVPLGGHTGGVTDGAPRPSRHLVIPIQRVVPRRYARDVEPPEIRARFGSVLLLMGFVLTLPAAGAGTIFSMAVATGQSPAWPTLGEGVVIYLAVLGFLGSWPLLGFLLGFGIRDGSRWVLLCMALSGAVPALSLGSLMVFADPGANASDFLTMELALAWMWALPTLGLVLVRAAGLGRPLPRLPAFLRMFGSAWRQSLPGVQTQWGEAVSGLGSRYELRVPGADFALPIEARAAVLGAGGRARVTYDLQRGRIETIEVGTEDGS